MELSTPIGIVLALIGVGVGMVIKGASLTALINPAAFLIIIVGAIACVFNAFPLEHVLKIGGIVKKLIFKPVLPPKEDLIMLFIDLAQVARRDGLLALESRLNQFEDPFMVTGLSMIIDGMDPELVYDVLAADISGMEERHREGAAILTQAGTYAPCLGVLGAVIGLIAALGNLTDIEKLGHSIAAAFVATMLGIFTGYVICLPFANKLKFISKQEADIKKMMLEGILSLQAGTSATGIKNKMLVFLSQAERDKMKSKLGDL